MEGLDEIFGAYVERPLRHMSVNFRRQAVDDRWWE